MTMNGQKNDHRSLDDSKAKGVINPLAMIALFFLLGPLALPIILRYKISRHFKIAITVLMVAYTIYVIYLSWVIWVFAKKNLDMLQDIAKSMNL